MDLKKFLVVVLTAFILLSVLIFSNKNLKSRYVDQILMHTIKKNSETTIFMPEHIGLFTAAINIFKKIFSLAVELKLLELSAFIQSRMQIQLH